MKTTSNTNDPGCDDATMRELLLSADRQEVEPPRDLLDRVRARLHENTVRSSLPAQGGRVHVSGRPFLGKIRLLAEKWTSPRTKRAWFAGAAAAAVVLIALLFSLQPSSIAWSQVAEAVRAMPWIHMKAVAGEGQAREVWISFSRNVAVMRDGYTVQYDDFRSGIRYQYDLPQKKLYRLSVNDGAAKEIESVVGLFQAILRGDAIRTEDIFGPHVIKQRQRTVTEEGRRWILYELELGNPNDRDPNHTGSVVIRVNPETKLPEQMTLTRGKEKVQATFDYPAEGPADIYALGVPRDARAEDRTPPPDLDRIIKIVQQNRRNFGNYLAIAGGNNGPRSSIVHLIRCKGDKFRVDDGVGNACHVASGNEMKQWWRELGREVLFEGMALSNGRRVYEHDFVRGEPWWKPSSEQIRQGDGRAAAERVRVSAGVNDAAEFFVELLAYSPRLSPQQLASSPLWTTHFDPKGENGPAGSVRVESLLAHQGGPHDHSAFHKVEFWLQPKYGYAVVKHVISDCPAVEKDPLRKEIVHEYDGFRQTPAGIWYPTVSRYKNAFQSKNKNKSGGVEFHDQVTYFYLDFAAELPDELFSTDWHGDPLVGIHFAQQDEKPTSNDLGKIRPPGGVPLFPSGEEITCLACDAATKRLEAAPAKGLDKWVAELERLTGKKPEGWVEQQAWRTEFVARVSVAFAGLKWNAKAADVLFNRAQTIPTSEAKGWKEAFERALNDKIEPSCIVRVPLVLIPVDALYEGQKYSDDRAKKYLARLKQLTAEDISLWLDKVDQWGGTRLDAAMNIILLDDYFKNEQFQRDKFKAAIGARLGRQTHPSRLP